jgi:hypothetical protein
MKLTAALFSALFFCALNTGNAQEVILSPEKELAAHHGVSYTLDKTSPVRSVFENARVINFSDDPNDHRNFGAYIETLIPVTYEFKGEPVTDEVYVVYSNLSQIKVAIDQTVDSNVVMGYGGGQGTPVYKNNTLFFLYVYTKNYSPFLQSKTESNYIEDNGIFWWDALSILREKVRKEASMKTTGILRGLRIKVLLPRNKQL